MLYSTASLAKGVPGGDIFRRSTTYRVSHIGTREMVLYRHGIALDPDPGLDLNFAVCD